MDDKNKFIVDYYITEKSIKNDDYNIVDKSIFGIYSSTGSLDDNFDIFIKKKNFFKNRIPKKHDLAFFQKEKKFYEVDNSQDAGDFYVVNIIKYKSKS